MSDLDLNIDFKLNSPEAKAAADEVRKSIKGVNEEATSGAQKTTAAEKEREGILMRLNRRLKELKQSQQEATSTVGIEKANTKIQEFEKEIQRLTRIGKVGFDDMGKAIPDFDKPIGKLNRLIAAQKLYEKAVRESTNTDVIAKYNRKLQETGSEINRLKNVGKKGFDELGNKIRENTGLLDKLKGGLGALAGALGVAFALQTVVQFGKELFGIAKETEGVGLAFSRIENSKKILQDLKEATRGQVNELELMRTAVKAADFKIPMDVLAKGLAFAQQKAADTGKDVDYLVNSFVDGIGRKSIRVIDNLNISQAEVQAEMKKTGDFATAVGNVIDRQMSAAGTQVDTLATKTGGMAAMWDNAKSSVAGFFRALLNPELADPKKIADLTDQYSKSYSKFGTYTSEQQKEIIANTEKIVKEQAEAYKKAREKYQNNTGGAYADLSLAKEGERLKALQNVLNNLKTQNNELEITERKKKGILSIEELEQELSDLKIKRDSELNRDEIKKLNKQIEDKQAVINELNGAANKKSTIDIGKAERERQAALDRQYSLTQKLNELNAEYTRKALNNNDAEVQAVRDKFAKIAEEVQKFNSNPKNVYKVDGSGLDGLLNQAITDLRYKQETARLKASLDEQRTIYADYEAYKNTYGEELANQRYKKELELVKTTTNKAAEEFAALNALSFLGVLDGKQQERLAVLQKDLAQQSQFVKQVQERDFLEAFEAAKNHEQRVADIKRRYAKLTLSLGKEITDDQLQELKEQEQAEITAANDVAFKKSAIYKKLALELLQYTKQGVREEIRTIEGILKTANLPENLKKDLEAQLSNLKGVLDGGFADANIAELNDRKQFLIKALADPLVQGTEAAKQYKKELSEIQNKIDKSKGSKTAATFKSISQAVGGGGGGGLEDLLGGAIPGVGIIKEILESLSKTFAAVSQNLNELSTALQGVNDDLAYSLGAISDLTGGIAKATGALADGDLYGFIISGITTVLNIGKKTREMNEKARAEANKYYEDAINGERAYQALVRQRERESAKAQANRLEGLQKEFELLKKQSTQIESEYQKLLRKLQQEQYITGSTYTHGTWFRRAQTTNSFGSLAGKDYEELEKLYTEGKLTEGAKKLFEDLQKLKNEGGDVAAALAEVAKQAAEIFTGTTADALTDSILNMFKEGKTSAQDFADFFESAMNEAALSIFKNQILAKQMDDFYKRFAEAAQSDGGLDQAEIEALRALFLQATEDAKKQFDALQAVTGTNIGAASSSGSNSYAGAYKSASQESIDFLGGQTSAMRITILEGNLTLKEMLLINNGQLAEIKAQHLTQKEIELNTRKTADNTTAINSELKGLNKFINDLYNSLRAAGRI